MAEEEDIGFDDSAAFDRGALVPSNLRVQDRDHVVVAYDGLDNDAVHTGQIGLVVDEHPNGTLDVTFDHILLREVRPHPDGEDVVYFDDALDEFNGEYIVLIHVEDGAKMLAHPASSDPADAIIFGVGGNIYDEDDDDDGSINARV